MRNFWVVGVFIVAGLLAALYAGFRPVLWSGRLPYDSEQEGIGERIVIKFNHVVAENTPKGLAAEHFAQLVKQKTNDRVEVQVYPNGILYSDDTEMDALLKGDIQMIAPAFSKLSDRFPEWLAMDLPFAFADQSAVETALKGEIGSILLRTLESKRLKGLAFWSNGFKQITSSRKPVLIPEDFKGQSFRIMPSSLIERQFQLLGAKTTRLSFNEVYRNLENGSMDGQENTISNIYTKRLYQVQKYLTLSNHGYLGYTVIVSEPFWSKLPSGIRSQLTEAMDETTRWMTEMAVSKNAEELELIRRSGAIRIFELTAEQREQWIRANEPVYGQFAPQIGSDLIRLIQAQRPK